MLFFKKELINTAYKIVETKETSDDVKALNYLDMIVKTIQQYNLTLSYDSEFAKQLDKKVRDEYPLIDELCSLPSNGSTQSDIKNIKEYPYEINCLNTDLYGILISVLIKKKIIGDAKEALENRL